MSTAWQDEVAAETRSGGRISDHFIVDKVRTAVLTQRLPPGTRLPEVALGEIFGVSRSVVRRAMTRLAADHVVTQRPNQVARVRAPSVEETRETFDARRLVEGEVVALLAGRLPKAQLDAIDELIEREARAYAHGNETERIEHSLAIHHLLAEHSPNRVLGSMLTDLVLRSSIVIALYKRAGLASCYLAEDHPALLVHLRSGDGEAARRCIHQHLEALEGLLDLGTREAHIDLMAILGQGESVTT